MHLVTVIDSVIDHEGNKQKSLKEHLQASVFDMGDSADK